VEISKTSIPDNFEKYIFEGFSTH